MSQTMLSRVQAYLARRRALGYKLLKEGRQLMDFGRYADRSGYRGPLTRRLAMDWASQTPQDQAAYRAQRLGVVRVFARHQAALEPRTEIPARHVLGSTYRRRPPHLFTARQLEHLLQQAKELSGRLRPQTYWTLLGLLACTGLRISEALALAVRDVDLEQGVLTIRQSKYQHSRILPLHPTALSPLRRYVRYRKREFPQSKSFFVSDRGGPLTYCAVGQVFPSLVQDIKPANGRPHARLHDLRHTFASRVLLRWQRTGRGATGRLAILSRYLGHTHLRETYWYLTAVPQLLEKAAEHFTAPTL